MRKSAAVLVLLIVLVLLFIAAPWLLGKRAQDAIQDAVAQANSTVQATFPADGGPVPALTVEHYERGVFSSDLRYRFTTVDASGRPLEFVLHQHLQHGPFPFGALRSGEFGPLLALGREELLPTPSTQIWFDGADGAAPLQGRTRVEFGGKASSRWTLAPLRLTANGDGLDFSGGRAELHWSNDFRDSRLEAEFDSLGVIAAETGETLLVRGLNLENRSIRAQEGDLRLETHARFDRISMHGPGSPTLEINEASVRLEGRQDERFLQAEIRYELGAVALGMSQLGSLALTMTGKRVDLEALTALLAQYDAIRAQHEAAEGEGFVMNPAEAAAMHERLLLLIQSRPEFSVGPLVWKNADGESEGRLQFALAPPETGEAVDPLVEAFFLSIFRTIELDVSVSRTMFVQAFARSRSAEMGEGRARELAEALFDEYLGAMEKSGLLVRQGDQAVSHLRYAEGMMEVNGARLPLAEFVQGVLGAALH